VAQLVEYTTQGLGNRSAKEYWRKLLKTDTSFYKSWIFEEVRDEGRAEGRVEARVEEKIGSILHLLMRRNLKVSEETRKRIEDCDDFGLLCEWFDRAITAPKAEAIFDADGRETVAGPPCADGSDS
jgi:hypothetical protein